MVRRPRRPEYARWGVVFIKLVLPVVSLEIGLEFHCHSFDYGPSRSRSFLVSDYSVDCDGGSYRAHRALAVVCVVVYVVSIPGAIFGVMWTHRRAMADADDPQHLEVVARYGLLGEAFKADCWYFETIEMAPTRAPELR